MVNKFLVIGRGKWGKKVINVVNKYGKIIEIIGSNKSYKKLTKKNINWVFVLTNDNSHFKITKYFLENNINVFCEKPLCLNYKDAKKLITLSKKNKIRLYISDIENYKNKKIKIFNDNKIIRQKLDKSKKNILFRLFYHDLYLLFNKASFNKILNIKIINNKNGEFIFSFRANNKKFSFYYNLNKKEKIHVINKTNYLNHSNNPLKTMIKSVLLEKVDFFKNNKTAMEILKVIEKIKKKAKN